MEEKKETKFLRPESLSPMAEIDPAISAPPFHLHCPSMTRSPSLDITPKTPKSTLASLLLSTPIASPMKKAIESMQCYFEEVGHFTKLDPQDAWLPITESRNGNAYYSAFHTLSSGLGAQALVLPLAFTTLSWTWGILCLSLVFMWQLYTLWLLVQLHESESGIRYSRYLRLSMAAFGEKQGKLLALFPIMYLSGWNLCDLDYDRWWNHENIFPNCLWRNMQHEAISCNRVCPLFKVDPEAVSYDPPEAKSDMARICDVLNALGIIAFAFRGHNLVLEIQGTMPSSAKKPSRKPMWRGVKLAYLIIATCLFPLAIGGYWAYGDLMPNGGMLNALHKYHGHDTSKLLLGLTSLFVVLNCLSSFQIYAMPVFDNLELRFTSKKKKPCPRWLRIVFRIFFGCLAFFISVALPFLMSLAGLIGGIALPVTLAYPCFMWIQIKKPTKYSAIWCLNWILGVSGMVLSMLVTAGAIWTIVTMGIEIHFFKPQ
ncbi:hypothetical protein OIU85_021880 [Salix viminalis]|uniref:Amino acid transporter transmembrane domain-containing protein n=1 Tax=Salix viminalis TaxID=40686 RepID=A0A9Q0UJI2_SALVM|nr:hypothetical protein OIU85_021880 [Salix viminalis]